MAENPYVNKVEYGDQTIMDISDTTAEEEDVVSGKTFYKANGAKSTGSAVVPDISNCYQSTDTAETDLQDSDYVPFYDDSASAKKNTLWSNIKSKLQTFFDGIYRKKLIASFNGAGSSDAYCLLCTITVQTSYINGVNEIILQERGRSTIARLNIYFENVSTADPSLLSFIVIGAQNNYYIVKIGTSTWQLYVTKSEPYSWIDVLDYSIYRQDTISITWDCVNAASIPSGAIQASMLTGVDNTKVAKAGDTMTGSLTFNGVANAINYTGTKATYPMIKFVDNTEDEYGNGVVIGGGGLTVIGGGESADTYAAGLSGGEESLYLTNDGNVTVVTNLQSGKSSGKTFTFGNDGTFNSPSTIKQNGTAVSLDGHTHNLVKDISGNNANTTFAYSKAGLGYGDYTWLAGWNGYELRAVAKTQFAQASHSHNYAGSSSAGGDANNALKLNGYASDTAATANTIVRRNANGYVYAVYYNQSSGSETATSSSYVMFCNSDGWLRKTPMSTIKSLVDTNTNTWRGFQFLSRTSGSQTIANNAVATFSFSGLNNVSGYAPRFAWYSGNSSTNKIIPCRAGAPCGDGTCSFTVFNLSGAQKTKVTITIYVLYTQ